MATAEQAQVTEKAAESEVVNTIVDAEASVAPRRYFTIPGRDPFDEIEWELRHAHIPGKDGPAFEQKDVEFPKFWSQTATNIVSQKYFRGRMASPERERSVKQMIGRVVDTIGGWGREGGYFAADEEAETFEAELKAILVKQYASFNSPVWFNVGFEAKPQCSACQPWNALISTPEGMVPIGQLVDEEQVGREVYDANGVTSIVAVKANGLKEVFRVTLRNGGFVEATADHVVKAVADPGAATSWLRVDQLTIGMRMLHFPLHVREVALAGQGGELAQTLEWTEDFSEEDVVAIEPMGVKDVYDIQTESGEYLTNNVAVHNCFILSIEDSMESILDWIRREGVIFRGGSGSGVNLSRLRSSKEQLSKGGYASGPVSFMRGADASAGTIKSGGKTRRAAKMVVLDVDHPDIDEFIWCKAKEERKARVLEAAGYDMSLDSPDWSSIQYQNANNSVRVTDAFMEAVIEGKEWNLTARTDGSVIETTDARDLLRHMAEAAWECADPGVQYDTTINSWHTLPNTSRINASNPCCFIGETLVDTEEGLLSFDELLEREVSGDPLPRVWSFATASQEPTLTPITNVWIAGVAQQLVEVTTHGGHVLRCTPEHRFLTEAGYIEAQLLEPRTELIGSGDEEILSPGALASLQRVVVRDSVAAVRVLELAEPVLVYDLEAAGEHNLTVGSQAGATIVVHNSEYMSIDDSACNLASLNLMKFRRKDGEFDIEAFEHAVDVVFLAQEIAVGYSSYPTPEIDKNAKAYRQLGLGYANLGALLMARGFPYDSDEGRAYAAAITALMTGRAYRKSAEVAKRMGPFAGYQPNAAAMTGVIAKHRAAVGNIDHSSSVPDELLNAARKAWDEALELGEVNGYRNAQASVLAPTGTISFMMDCDTTGVEPDFSLVKSKKLVGGGEITIVNKTVPLALDRLGYAPNEVDEIVAYIDERNTVVSAPHMKAEHYPVFDCAIGDRAIHYMGHVKMMGAVQPAISGALSKTVNLPEETTVDEISQLLIESWQLGVKAIAIYRDNCKVAQPLSGKANAGATTLAPVGAPFAGHPQRRRLPDDRVEVGRKFAVGEYEGYIHVGLFDDGTPGDIFVDIAKEGTTLAGLMNSFMISVSLGLQYGVPLEVYVSKFSHMRFEPSGMTNDADIRVAKSLVDYIFRWMGKKFLSTDQQEEAGILTAEVKQRLAAAYNEAGDHAAAAEMVGAAAPGQTALFNQWEDAVECARCGGRMVRTGSCYTCRDCGTNTGCS